MVLLNEWQLNASNFESINIMDLLIYFLKKCIKLDMILFNEIQFEIINRNDKLIQFTQILTKRQIEYAEIQVIFFNNLFNYLTKGFLTVLL